MPPLPKWMLKQKLDPNSPNKAVAQPLSPAIVAKKAPIAKPAPLTTKVTHEVSEGAHHAPTSVRADKPAPRPASKPKAAKVQGGAGWVDPFSQ